MRSDVQAEEASVGASDASLRSQTAAVSMSRCAGDGVSERRSLRLCVFQVRGVRLPVPPAGLAQVSHDQAQGGGGPGVRLCDLRQALREGTQSERAHVHGASSPAGRRRSCSRLCAGHKPVIPSAPAPASERCFHSNTASSPSSV